jgi:collagen type III alpha
MTGKDEWRLIHMQGGVLTDSLLNKPKDSDKPEASTLGQNISALPGLGELASAGQAQPNAVNRRRASEGGTGGGVGPDGQPIQSADQTNGPQAGTGPAATSGTPGIPGMPGGPMSPFGGVPGSGGVPGMPGVPGQFPGQPPPVAPGQLGLAGLNPGTNALGQNGASAVDPNAPNPGIPGTTPGQNGAATNMLNNLLNTPNPRGLNALIQNQGTVVGGGMAGVASKMDAEGLMVYGDRTNYKEWEFVYDPSKDRPRPDPRAMMTGIGTTSSPTPGTTPSAQNGMFNQPGQSGMNSQTQTSGPGGTTGQNGTNGQTGQGQSGTPASANGYSQGGSQDIRPGKK